VAIALFEYPAVTAMASIVWFPLTVKGLLYTVDDVVGAVPLVV